MIKIDKTIDENYIFAYSFIKKDQGIQLILKYKNKFLKLGRIFFRFKFDHFDHKKYTNFHLNIKKLRLR